MTPADRVWASFAHDPREPANAPLRASDRDREVVSGLLADAYADGRLDRAEFDTRAGEVAAARTLGDLPPLMADLVPASPATPARIGAQSDQLRERAIANWAADRRNAAWVFLSASVVCWVIWLTIGFGPDGWEAGFPWPVFVMLGTGVNLARLQFQREDLIVEGVRHLEKKQAARQARELKARGATDRDAADQDAADEDSDR